MPIVQEGEERPKRGRRHRWWLTVLLLPLVLLVGLVVYPFFRPIELTVGSRQLVLRATADPLLADMVPHGITHVSNGVTVRAGPFAYGIGWY